MPTTLQLLPPTPTASVVEPDDILAYLERLLREDPATRIIVVQGERTPAAAAPALSLALDREAIREAAEQAVRQYHVPERLTHNPLARGAGPAERVSQLRGLVDAAVTEAFGTSYNDISLREVLTAGYLDASAQHERAALDLHMSRSTYFRKLRTAVTRVVDQLEAGAAADQPSSARASLLRERMFSLS
jgi:hypothetical protein